MANFLIFLLMAAEMISVGASESKCVSQINPTAACRYRLRYYCVQLHEIIANVNFKRWYYLTSSSCRLIVSETFMRYLINEMLRFQLFIFVHVTFETNFRFLKTISSY